MKPSSREELRRRAAESPEDAAAHRELAEALYDDLEFDEALTHFERASALAPDDPECHFWIGRIHHGRADLEASVAPLQRCVALDPDHAPARFMLGRVLKSLGRAAELQAEIHHLERLGKREWAASLRKP
jgi:tetratricopeptide (TPR) repeat protein